MKETQAGLAAECCMPRRGPGHALSPEAADALLAVLPGWTREASPDRIVKDFKFSNYDHTMAFVNAVAWIAHTQDHHPDLAVGYGHCRVSFNTHDVGGLSRNDFVCAARVESLGDRTS